MVIKKIWRVLNSELIKAILSKDPWLKGLDKACNMATKDMSSEEFLNVARRMEQTEKDKKLRKGNVANVNEVQTKDSDSDVEVNAVKNKGKGKNRNKKKRQERKSDQKKETICWHCQKAGHIKPYCPQLKAQKAEKWRKVNEAAASGINRTASANDESGGPHGFLGICSNTTFKLVWGVLTQNLE